MRTSHAASDRIGSSPVRQHAPDAEGHGVQPRVDIASEQRQDSPEEADARDGAGRPTRDVREEGELAEAESEGERRAPMLRRRSGEGCDGSTPSICAPDSLIIAPGLLPRPHRNPTYTPLIHDVALRLDPPLVHDVALALVPQEGRAVRLQRSRDGGRQNVAVAILHGQGKTMGESAKSEPPRPDAPG